MGKDSKLEKELEIMYDLQKEIITLKHTTMLVWWDQLTYMPKAGARDCSEKVSLLSKLTHERLTSKELKNSVDYLLKPKNFKKLSDKDQVVVKRLHKDIEKESKKPLEFVEELSRVASMSSRAWEEAKKESDFEIFQPHLENIVRLKKKECKIINLPGHPYNSLLDEFEEGITTDKLDNTFSFLGIELSKLLKKVQASEVYKAQSEELLKQDFSSKKQEKASHLAMKLMNLPKDKSRLDVSAHPFTVGIGYNDVRITTRYVPNPLESLGSTMHEAGHDLIELGLPKEYAYTVVCDIPSLGLHESQSRFWENMVGRSERFWRYFFPKYKDIFKTQLKDVEFDEWFKIVNLVKPSFIRTEADELTYCLHVILRYEIEKDLIEGNIEVKDLPEVWNDKFEKLFGIRPKKDSEGLLQDVHWSEGLIGYFPTYALGSIYAAQLYNQLVKENPSIKEEIESGKLENVLSWLEDNVYKYGRSLTAEETIIKACGEGLNPKAYIKYLDDKYSKIYEV